MSGACHKAQTYTYSRRRPEDTPLFKVVQSEFRSFEEERAREERPLPDYVVEEFEAYLKCGILAHGFLRLACDSCDDEKAVAFSCKRRGFCPSCWGKRMAESAAHLVDNVLPHHPYRQFVISLPFALRYWINANRRLSKKVKGIIIK